MPSERTGSGVQGLAERPGLRIFPEADGSGVWIEHDIAPEDWRSRPEGWLALEVPHGHAKGDLELRAGGEPLKFFLHSGALLKRLETPPASATLRCFARRSAPGIYGGELLALWPGEKLSWTVDVAADSELSFQSLTLGARGLQSADDLHIEVLVDGVSATVLRVPASLEGGLQHHRVALPPGRDVRIELAASGAPIPSWILSPVLTPRSKGTPSTRPWPESRPDILIVLADTFRADLLAAYGGKSGCTPGLDAFAAQCRRFLEARSTSTWTLPAHASLFTGLWPSQHGAEKPALTFDPALPTLTEALHAAGYRTGALTDGGHVSRALGFEAGFEWFREVQVRNGARLADTLAAADAFLAADDGRPTFLFVHTYRVHSPYRSDETSMALDFHDQKRRMGEARERGEPVDAIVAELRRLYEVGVRRLDEELAPWLGRLQQSGRFERGVLVFTSDHGEAFHEHGTLFHANAPHEEEVRVPLLLHGAGIEPGDVSSNVSLIDLFPTLARLARAEIPTGLPGQDLLLAGPERTLFMSVYRDEIHELAVLAGAKKLFARRENAADPVRDARALYDLGSDPRELVDLLGNPGGREFAAAAASAYVEVGSMLGRAQDVHLTPDDQEALRALGYGE